MDEREELEAEVDTVVDILATLVRMEAELDLASVRATTARTLAADS